MNKSRIEWKVGLFVFFGLVLLAALMLSFSKGITLFKSTYKFHIVLPTVSGLKPNADVMMSGVPVGKVVGTKLNVDGKTVTVTVTVLAQYPVHKDAKIHIEALGFLGDQYIEITPQQDKAPVLQNNETIEGKKTEDLQTALGSVSGLIDQAKDVMKNLDLAITNINKTVLTEKTLTRFASAISNFEGVAESAHLTLKEVEGVLSSNGPAIHSAISNLDTFSTKINGVADDIHGVVATNQTNIAAAVKNLRDVSEKFQQLANDLQAGKGLAGGLLKDEKMKGQMTMVMTNVSEMTANFSAFASNINHKGIWHMLWKQQDAGTNPAPAKHSDHPTNRK